MEQYIFCNLWEGANEETRERIKKLLTEQYDKGVQHDCKRTQ